jgi:hypothetical protein
MKPLDKYDFTLVYQLDVCPLVSRPVPHSVISNLHVFLKPYIGFYFSPQQALLKLSDYDHRF